MISLEQYIEALKLVQKYHDQIKLPRVDQVQERLVNQNLKQNDYIEYLGNTPSRYLIRGNKYRLTSPPWIRDCGRAFVSIINDNGKRRVMNQRHFKNI